MSEPAPGPIGAEAPEEIDSQHHQQLNLVRMLRRAVEAGAEAERLAEIADALLSFTKMHFASEELLMRLDAYDGYEAHAAAHAQTIERIEAVCARAEGSTAAWNRHDLVAIEQTITLHIATSDYAFAEHLAAAAQRT